MTQKKVSIQHLKRQLSCSAALTRFKLNVAKSLGRDSDACAKSLVWANHRVSTPQPKTFVLSI